MERSLRRLEEHFLPEAPQPEAAPSTVLMFSVSSKCLSISASLSEVTTAFFRNKYSLIKPAVRLVLLNAESFPLPSNNRAEYKKDVCAIARAAEERIRIALRFDDKETITRSKLEKQAGLKELEQSLQLPRNTPQDWCKFFKS